MNLAEKDRRLKAKAMHDTACQALGIKPIAHRHRFGCTEDDYLWTLTLPVNVSGTVDRCPNCGAETKPYEVVPVYPPMNKET